MSNHRLQRTGESAAPDSVAAAVFSCGLTIAASVQLAHARQFAVDRIGGAVASLASLRRIRSLAAQSILVFREFGEITGVLGVLPLSAEGHAALLDGDLDLERPRRVQLTSRFEAASALYAMGIASCTPDAARAVVSGVVRLREAFAQIPFFARPVTDAGRRVLFERLSCVPVDGSDLLWSPACSPLRTAA